MYSVIFVDDEEFIREQFIKRVKWNELGFELAASFSNGEDALAFIKNQHIDLAILDIKLPGMSGLELCRHISKHSPGTSVIFLSAYADFTYAVEGIKYGVISYLTKPIMISELTDELKKMKLHLDNINNSQSILLIHLSYENFKTIGYTYTEKYRKSTDLNKMYGSVLSIQFLEDVPLEAKLINDLFSTLTDVNKPIICIRNFKKDICEILVLSPNDFTISNSDLQVKLNKIIACTIHEIHHFCGISNIDANKAYNAQQNDDSNIIITKVKDYVAKHYSESISLDNVAKSVFITPSYLSSLFKLKTGVKFSEYLTNYRIEKAQDLLINSSYKISDICKIVGYRDINHFYKTFRKITGVSPNKYRNV